MDKKLTTSFGAPVDDNQNIAIRRQARSGVAAKHLVY